MSELAARKKHDTLLRMLDGGLVMLHLDPRAEAVSVPPQYGLDPVLRLNVAYGFNLPALEIDDEGVYAVLSFNRVNFPCHIPWGAIFAMTSPHDAHEGFVWPEDVPPELSALFQDAGAATGPVTIRLGAPESRPQPTIARPQPAPARAQASSASAPDEPMDAPPTPPLLVVHEGGRADDGGDEAAPSPERKGKRPTLTVVKNGS